MNHCSVGRENEGDPTWGPEYRLACEAAMLLRMPLAQRRQELAVPARVRRRAALENEMRRQWENTNVTGLAPVRDNE